MSQAQQQRFPADLPLEFSEGDIGGREAHLTPLWWGGKAHGRSHKPQGQILRWFWLWLGKNGVLGQLNVLCLLMFRFFCHSPCFHGGQIQVGWSESIRESVIPHWKLCIIPGYHRPLAAWFWDSYSCMIACTPAYQACQSHAASTTCCIYFTNTCMWVWKGYLPWHGAGVGIHKGGINQIQGCHITNMAWSE